MPGEKPWIAGQQLKPSTFLSYQIQTTAAIGTVINSVPAEARTELCPFSSPCRAGEGVRGRASGCVGAWLLAGVSPLHAESHLGVGAPSVTPPGLPGLPPLGLCGLKMLAGGEGLMSRGVGLSSVPGSPECRRTETQSLFDWALIRAYPENSVPFIETNQQKITLSVAVPACIFR